jgi:hypothetical protein
MTDCIVRVLGRVEVRVAGRARRLPAQQAKVLAMLVAAGAGGVVTRSELLDALWPTAPRTDRLSPVISRLRGVLGATGLTVSTATGTHGYRLEAADPAALRAAVDALRFTDLAARAHALLADGRPNEALEAFAAAATVWGGEPFDGFPDGWDLPRVCRDARVRWARSRSRLVRAWAATALGHADLHTDSPVEHAVAPGPTAADDDALWLLGFLGTLRTGGTRAAERLLEERRHQNGHDPLTARAFHLLTLREAGVDVHAPPLPPPLMPPADEPLDPALAAAFLDAARDRRSPVLTVSAPTRSAAAAAAGQIAARLTAPGTATGARVIRARAVAGTPLSPWPGVMGPLWAGVLRDLSAGSSGWSGPHTATLAALVAGADVVHTDLPEPVAESLRHAARATPLVVALEEMDSAAAPALDLLAAVVPRLEHSPVAVIVTRRVAGAPAVSAELTLPVEPSAPDPALSEWLAAADATAWDGSTDSTERENGRRLDLELVAALLGQDQETADRMLTAATHAGCVRVEQVPHLVEHDWVRRARSELQADPARLRALHRDAYAALLTRTRPPDDPERAEAIAAHAVAAGEALPDADVARACLQAARLWQANGRPVRAARRAEEGLRATTDTPVRFDLLLVLGDAGHDAGDIRAAEAGYLRAHGAAGPDPLRRAVALVRLARRWSEPGQLDQQLVALLEQDIAALDAVGGAAARELGLLLRAHLAHKLTMAVITHSPAGAVRFGRGVRLAGEVLADLDGLTPQALAEVLVECRWARYDAASPAELVGVAERLEEVTAAAGSAASAARHESDALMALAVDRLRLGRVNAARSAVEKHRSLAQRTGRLLDVWLQHTCDTVLDLWHGKFDEAQARLHGDAAAVLHALGAAAVPHADNLQQTWTGQVYWLYRERGQFPELAAQGVLTSVERHGFFPVWLAGLALMHAELDRADDAADQVRALFAETDGLATLPPHGWSVPTLVLLAEACATVQLAGYAGLDTERERLHELLVPHSEEFALAGWPTVLLGPVSRSLGLLRLAAGDAESAVRHFAAATRNVGAARPQLARLRYDTALAMSRLGHHQQAHRLLGSAGAAARDMGMARLAASVAELLTNLGDPIA